MIEQGYLANTVTGADATQRRRLTNFDARAAELKPAHRVFLAEFANSLRMHVVTDVFINGYAHDDKTVGLARANAVAAEFTRHASWLSPVVSTSYTNDAPLRASHKHSDEFWRGVDVLAYVKDSKPAGPTPPAKDEIPPMPGPKRFSDWEVFAEWGCSFNVGPLAAVTFNAYHFRRKAPNTAYGAWCGSVQFGAGATVDAAKALKLARLLKVAGMTRILRLLRNMPSGAAKPIKDALADFAKSATGSFSDPSYSDAPASTPFAVSDLNGATAFGESIGAGAAVRSFTSAHLSVNQKMPQYELKFIDNRTPPRWVLVRHHTVPLVHRVDVGGWATGIPVAPNATASFVGGPLILME